MLLTLKCTEIWQTEAKADVRFADGKGKTMHLQMTLDESREFSPGKLVAVRLTPLREEIETQAAP